MKLVKVTNEIKLPIELLFQVANFLKGPWNLVIKKTMSDFNGIVHGQGLTSSLGGLSGFVRFHLAEKMVIRIFKLN